MTPWKSLMRMLALLPVDMARLARDDRWIAGLATLTLALWLGFNRWQAGPDPEWYPTGFTSIATCALFIVSLAWVVWRIASPQVTYRTVLLVIFAFLPAAVVAYAAIESISIALAPLGAVALMLLGIVYLDRYLRRLGVARPINAVLGAALISCLFFLASYGASFLYPRIWFENYDEDISQMQERWEDRESLLFEQASRVDAEVAGVAARDPARPNVFFAGFAGYAEQRVFAEEIKFARRIVGDRYGSLHRSVLLLNDQRDRDTKPLATVSGLRRALAGIAGKMDLEQDILFLVLSSHGSEAALLSVSHSFLPLDQLTGDALRKALEDSGVRWRVIVISACHSGAFIDSLKDDNTIILTAAAANRTSFGCSDERDLTYFGEAFFRDALPRATSLRQAFETARAAIAVREAKEGVDASEPQAHFGPAIEQHWSAFEQQLNQ